jgi:hypothetical protein
MQADLEAPLPVASNDAERQRAHEPQSRGSLALQVLHEPLFILAPAAQSAEAAEGPAGAVLPAASQRTLHCCYACPPQGRSAAVLVATDECGELLHSQLVAGASPGKCMAVSRCCM